MSRSIFHAFTKKTSGRLREILTEIGVSLPFVESDMLSSDNRILKTRALWDTGASNCVVTKQTAKELNLRPISVSQVSHADGITLANVYLVNIYLPNNLVVPNVRVTECADSDGLFGVIIGMDVITLGDLAITNVGENTTVSFRIPSLHTIDHLHEQDEIKKGKTI
jgi:predicted aspartyl protease